MGTMIPIATQALSAVKTIGTVASLANQGMNLFGNSATQNSQQALAHLQQQQKLNQQNLIAENNLRKQEILLDAGEAERIRRQSLKRAVAKRKAEFGSSGIAIGDGSSEAVLLGLFQDSEAERLKNAQADQLRFQTLDQSVTNKKRLNTLTRTQEAEKAKLTNASNPFEQVRAASGILSGAAGLFD